MVEQTDALAGDTWRSRDLPIVEYVTRVDAEGRRARGSDEIAGATGLDQRDVRIGLAALIEAGYLAAAGRLNVPGATPSRDFVNIWPLERARRASGQWPAEDAYDEFLRRLEAQLAATDDPGERSRLERLRDSALEVGRHVLGELIADTVRRGF